MTKLLIDLYEPYDLELNVYQCLVTDADRVLFLSLDEAGDEEQQQLRTFIKAEVAGIHEVLFEQVSLTTLDVVLDRVCADFDEVVLDTHGGDSLLAVAIYQYGLRRGHDVVAIDVANGQFYTWSDEGVEVRDLAVPILTTAQVLALRGGEIISSREEELSSSHFQDIKSVARFALNSPGAWNAATQFFSHVSTKQLHADTKKILRQQGKTYHYPKEVAGYLKRAGMLEVVRESHGQVAYRYPSEAAEVFCRNKGFVLEVFLYILAVESGLFDECHMGVEIDWNGIFPEQYNVQNEIDLVLRRGRQNVFISCKMAEAVPDALNELEVYAQHFVGESCLKVFVCTGRVTPAFANRCQEYGIVLIETDEVPNFIKILKAYL